MNLGNVLQEFLTECWDRVFAEVHDAAVYIDHPAAECLHWYTGGKGFSVLKAAGALIVQELNMYNFRYARVTTKKAVVISTSDDMAFYRRTIKMILARNDFEIVKILCSAPSRPVENQSDYSKLEETFDHVSLKNQVKSWMTSKPLQQDTFVGVSFVPLFMAPISSDLFITPPFGSLMPDVNSMLTSSLLSKAENLAHSFRTLFERANLREDVYFIGKLSEHVAGRLHDLAAATEHKRSLTGEPSTGISLILIDRTLDLCTPTSNDTECFLARILRTLPRLPHHRNDVAINMAGLFNSAQENSSYHIEIPGCLASSDPRTIDALITEQPKQIFLLASRTLNDALPVRNSPRPRIASRITAHSLQKLVDKFQGAEKLTDSPDFSKEFQTILAAIAASMSDKTAQLELLTSLEKLALQNLSVSGESSSILVQLSNIIRTRATRGLDTENLLALLVNIYALAGTQVRFTKEHEALLEKSIADAVYADISVLKDTAHGTNETLAESLYLRTLLLLGAKDDQANDENAKQVSQKIAAHCREILGVISLQRSTLHKYRSMMMRPNAQEAARRVGILEQLITDILSVDEPSELPDLRQSSATSLVSVGFNFLLRGRTKHHPRDNPWIFIYVIGGLSPEEIKTARGLASKYNVESRIVLGGTSILNPSDVVDDILLSSINTG